PGGQLAVERHRVRDRSVSRAGDHRAFRVGLSGVRPGSLSADPEPAPGPVSDPEQTEHGAGSVTGGGPSRDAAAVPGGRPRLRSPGPPSRGTDSGGLRRALAASRSGRGLDQPRPADGAAQPAGLIAPAGHSPERERGPADGGPNAGPDRRRRHRCGARRPCDGGLLGGGRPPRRQRLALHRRLTVLAGVTGGRKSMSVLTLEAAPPRRLPYRSWVQMLCPAPHRFVQRLILERGLKTGLDIGCGESSLLTPLRAYGFQSVGLDAWPEQIDRARALDLHDDYLVGDIRTLTPGRSFDVVVLNHMIEHLPR